MDHGGEAKLQNLNPDLLWLSAVNPPAARAVFSAQTSPNLPCPQPHGDRHITTALSIARGPLPPPSTLGRTELGTKEGDLHSAEPFCPS